VGQKEEIKEGEIEVKETTGMMEWCEGS